jgi:hypothetical protein
MNGINTGQQHQSANYWREEYAMSSSIHIKTPGIRHQHHPTKRNNLQTDRNKVLYFSPSKTVLQGSFKKTYPLNEIVMQQYTLSFTLKRIFLGIF